MEDISNVDLIDVINRDRELIARNIKNAAEGVLPSSMPRISESFNLIGVITKVNPDFTVDIFIPDTARTISSISFVQVGFGSKMGLIISPEEGMPCIVSRTKDKRWFAYGGVTFKQGVSPRGLKGGEIELYSGQSSLKADVGGALNLISPEVRLRSTGECSALSSAASISAENVDVVAGSINDDGKRVGYTRISIYESYPVNGPFTLSESKDVSSKARVVSGLLSELLRDITESSFENDIEYIRKRVESTREAIAEPRELIARVEFGAAIDAELVCVSDLEKVDPKYIIKDRGIPCIYRLILYKDKEKTLEKRIYKDGEEVLM